MLYPIAVEKSPLAIFVDDCIPLPLVVLRLNGELDGRLVSCEPSPINDVAVTEPATFVVPSK